MREVRPATEHRYAVAEAGADELDDLTRMRLDWSADDGFAATDDFSDRMRRWSGSTHTLAT